jgi:tetratricopeptide (TPR) repeat protein/tRNA A-37 threonylcarbamoyl transferase component Bud32
MNDDERLKLAQAVADKSLNVDDVSDVSHKPFADLQRIVNAFRSAAGEPAADTEQYEFKWRHLLVKEQIGHGGFGNVYRAYDPILRRDVALKLARLSRTAAEAAIIAEARLMARLRHPNILAIHGADTDSEQAGIWCDLLSGETLERVLREQPQLSSAEVLPIAHALASALQAIHAAGLTHGDIKPANVMMTPDAVPILMDFGAGRELRKAWSSGVGTPLYMAPEQFESMETSAAADVYAFGALLYRALSGRHPLEAGTFEELEALHRQGVAPGFKGVDRKFRALLRSMLRARPEQRPTAFDVHRAILALVEAPKRRARRIALAAVIGSLSIGLVVSVVATWRAQQAEARATAEQVAAQAALSFLQDLLDAPNGVNQGANVRMVDAIDEAELRLRANLPSSVFVRAKVQQTLGMTYQNLDQYDKARPLLESALQLFVDGAAECCNDEIDTRIDLAKNSLAGGRVEEAFAELSRAESQLSEVEGEFQNQLVQIMLSRANAHYSIGETEAAKAQLIGALALTDNYQDTAGYVRARLQAGLASILRTAGDIDEAESVARESLSWYENNGFGERMDSTEARHVLSTLLLIRGDFAQAEQLSRQNLEILDRYAPDVSHDRVAVLTNIVETLLNSGQEEESLLLAQELYENAVTLHGPRHEMSLKIRANIGVALTSLERYAEAAELFRANWSTQREVVGEYALDTLMSRGNYAEALLFSGSTEEALDVAGAARAANSEALGSDHLVTLYFTDVLAVAQSRLGMHAEAIATLERNRIDKTRNFGEDNPMVWDSVAYLVEALLAAGDSARALPMAQTLLTRRSEILGETHPASVRAAALLTAAERAAAANADPE